MLEELSKDLSENLGGRNMPDKKRCLLSVAMIMKNEEHNLDRALGSIKPYVDEIIVVDTGSTDNSVEVAKKYTDKIYFHEWKDDFSEARNYSLQFPTCEWVLIYDADEEVKEDFAGIREFLASLPDDVNTVYLPTLSYLDWDLKKTEIASTARVFRNGTVRYENIVHNQPIYKGKVVEAPFTIYHYGYIWTRKLKKKKYERTRNLIVKLLEEKKDIPSQERAYYLCQLYKSEMIGGNAIELYPIVNKVIEIIKKDQKMPAIAFEVLLMHALPLNAKGFNKEARELLEFLLRIEPKNPDPYYGLLAVSEAEKKYEETIFYGEEFLKRIEYVEKNPQEFTWTIIAIKYTPMVHTLLAIAYLKKKDIEKFKMHFEKIFDKSKLTVAEAQKLVNALVRYITEVDDDDFVKIVAEVEKLLLEAHQFGVPLNLFDIVERVKKIGLQFNYDLFEPFLRGNFGKLVLENLKTKKDGLMEYIFGPDENQWAEKIEKMGLEAVLFFYENLPNSSPEKLRVLNKLRKSENEVIKGVSHGLIADIYLEKANFKLALEYYKTAAEILPELGRFVKPILDDLKTKLDPTIEGIFHELKRFYFENKELMMGALKEFPKDELERLHLISDTDFAKYISATNIWKSNKEKAARLLDSISKKEEFPFLEYRYAKLFEDSKNQEELKKAYLYHAEALKKNTVLGDLALGVYKFDNFYPHEVFGNKNDEIAWVGNISEKHSGLGVISPLRVWRKANRYYYVEPFHVDEAIRIYKQKRNNYNLPTLEVKREDVLKVLGEVNMTKIRVCEEDEKYAELVKNAALEIGIEYDDKSENIVSFEIVNIAKEVGDVLKNFESGVLFYFVPDFNNHDDIVWYYPIFRFIRTRKQVEDELRKAGAKKIRHYVLNESLRAVVFER
ncbi:tetratricopeptide repeat-containing glycosyltransferase family 2 protein [Fervidobacterium sp.]